MKKISESVKAAVINEYHNGDLTVMQISKKYNVSLRVVYMWTDAKTVRRHHNKKRINLRLTEAETETLLESVTNYKGFRSELAKTLENKLEEKLAELQEIETANKTEE